MLLKVAHLYQLKHKQYMYIEHNFFIKVFQDVIESLVCKTVSTYSQNSAMKELIELEV